MAGAGDVDAALEDVARALLRVCIGAGAGAAGFKRFRGGIEKA